MRLSNIILITLAIWLGTFQRSIAQEDDDDFKTQHRFSFLPSQIALGEYSLFYEYRPSKRYAFEISGGYHGKYPEWHPVMSLLLDYQFEGVVGRGTLKIFLPKKFNSWYLAPMALFKGLSADYIQPDNYMPEWETRRQISRTVLGLYGLIGYRTTGTVYLEVYAGWGLRTIHDFQENSFFKYSEYQYSNSYSISNPIPDMKFGVKLGVRLP